MLKRSMPSLTAAFSCGAAACGAAAAAVVARNSLRCIPVLSRNMREPAQSRFVKIQRFQVVTEGGSQVIAAESIFDCGL